MTLVERILAEIDRELQFYESRRANPSVVHLKALRRAVEALGAEYDFTDDGYTNFEVLKALGDIARELGID